MADEDAGGDINTHSFVTNRPAGNYTPRMLGQFHNWVFKQLV